MVEILKLEGTTALEQDPWWLPPADKLAPAESELPRGTRALEQAETLYPGEKRRQDTQVRGVEL